MRSEGRLSPELAVLAARLKSRLTETNAGAAALRLLYERAPDERLALAYLLKLAEQSPALVVRALADEALGGDLIFCLGCSELIGTALGAMGEGWLEFFSSARAANESTILNVAPPDGGAMGDRGAAGKALADFKRRMFTRIAIADLLRRLDVAGTMRAMSRLADGCIIAALAMARRVMGGSADGNAELCVLALGKLGVHELNLASDIDLLYLFQASEPEAGERAAKEAATLTELLSANCFRVDLRLRPGGRYSPLATSIRGALTFYENFGQTWERAALLRSREVAGALAVGRRLRAELSRFIYRRYLDFDTLRQLRAMKRQIEDELRSPDAVERNIKLGYGGIRELEFIVQALTLVYGGRDPRLREARTIPALEQFGSLGYLKARHARQLAEAYLFLRDVEHKLQVVAGLQTHSIPGDEAGIKAVAARMGFGKGREGAKRLRTALSRHRDLVAALFRQMLGEDKLGAKAGSAGAQAAWQAALDPKQAAPPLKELGFAAPTESAGHLMFLAAGPAHSPASPRRREMLDRLGPLLIDEISRLADPDLAMMNLAAFIAAVGARTSFLSLIEQHPATRRVLLMLFASSRYLSTIFIRHPDMLDTLVRSDLARLRRREKELAAELGQLMAACGDFESRLDALRAFHHQEFLRVAIADLAGDLELEEVQAELTALAETILHQAIGLARREVAERLSSSLGSLALCAIAMGRLGAREMTYNSDLDLIFVYHDRAEVAASAHLPAAKIVQKLIAVLETRTPEGYAYKLDLRLRPSGYAGPLVVSLEGFRNYHRQSSAVWERQALVRARVVDGEEALAGEVEAAREEFVFGRGLRAAEVAEIAAMRARMEREIGAEDKHRLNIKQGRGGLVDIEFITQMMALRYGRQFPELRRRGTIELVRGLGRCGLLAEAEAHELESGHRFLSQLENRLRIESDRPAWALPTEPAELSRIARRMGYQGANGEKHLLADLKRRRERIRAIFERRFAAEQRQA